MPRKYWKVIDEHRNSALMNNRSIMVHYPVGKWVKPKIRGSKLMVFTNKSDAQFWMSWKDTVDNKNKILHLKVVSCHIRHSTRVNLANLNFLVGDRLLIKDVKTFWRLWNEYGSDLIFRRLDGLDISFNMPKGTIFAGEVMCLE